MSDAEKKYSDDQDYCAGAEKFQSVPSYDETKQKLSEKGEDPTDEAIKGKREETSYSCSDDYSMGTIQDDKIYIATTDKQHERFAGKEPEDIPPADDKTRLSGYFSDQATVDACKDGDTLDNTKYNQTCQIEPYQPDGTGDATYKPHVDCFEIDRGKLQENYGTDDFNAAIAKCEANNQYGEGGGNQGYNPHINEMIENGTLKHKPEESYTDKDLTELDKSKQNEKDLKNSTVAEDDYVDMKHNAETRSRDCVKNDTPHPSEEACKNGFPKNQHPVESNTGNAKPVTQKENEPKTDNKTETDPQGKTDKGKTSEMPTKAADEGKTDNGKTESIPTTAHPDDSQNANNAKQTAEVPTTNSRGPSAAPQESGGKSGGEDIQR